MADEVDDKDNSEERRPTGSKPFEFSNDDYTVIKLKKSFARTLGNHLLASECENKAIVAFAENCRNTR